jgi:LmbE family N-acetylglucosaminyl deacetylase
MKPFLGKKLLFSVAHPDDESFLAGGTIYKNHQLGGKNFIVCATFGEKGKSHMKKPVTERQLKQIRKRELTAVAKFLKADGLFTLNFPDTKVNKNISTISRKLEDIIKKVEPDYIISFGSDGISGHLDHITMGKISRRLAQKNHIPFLAFGAPPALRKNFNQIKTRRRHGKYAAKVVHATPNIKVKIDLTEKRKVVKLHKSQTGNSTLSPGNSKSIRSTATGYEYFVKTR